MIDIIAASRRGLFVCNYSAFLHSVVSLFCICNDFWSLTLKSTCKCIIFSQSGRQGGLVKMWKAVKNTAYQKLLGQRYPTEALSCASLLCKGWTWLFLLICVMPFLVKKNALPHTSGICDIENLALTSVCCAEKHASLSMDKTVLYTSSISIFSWMVNSRVSMCQLSIER